MRSPLSKPEILALVLAVALSLTAGGTTVVETAAGHDAPPEETFVVQQGDTCYETTALGNGSTTVESFYNYSVDTDYSSAGTPHLQDNQVSNLFVYHGTDGYSLVFLHDEYGDAPYSSTITMTVTGLPETGTWAVEDDDYEGRDDNYDHYGTRSEIDWMWALDRTDGAAFRGLMAEDDVSITVDPAFNEEAEYWGDWWASGDENNRIETWRLLGESGATVSTLDMTRNVTIAAGSCDQTPPTASLSVNQTDVPTDQAVAFDASASTDNEEITAYRWDFDGDGTIDSTSSTATAATSYETSGEYTATVTVVDASGNTDTASVMVNVTTDDTEPPPTELSVGDGLDTQSGTKVTVPLALTNEGDAQAFILNVSAPGSFTMSGQSPDGGTWNANETKWLWQTVGTNETVEPSVTLAIPEDASGNYTVEATALAAESQVATDTGTITVRDCHSVAEAIDEDDNGLIGDFEVLTAIEHWRTGEEVPGTCGASIDDPQALELIEMWRNETPV